MALSPAEIEQAKLTASWLNSIASGTVVTGTIAPAAAALLGVTNADGRLLGVFALVWLSVGVGLHFLARAALKRLDDHDAV